MVLYAQQAGRGEIIFQKEDGHRRDNVEDAGRKLS